MSGENHFSQIKTIFCKFCKYETNKCKDKANGREGRGWGADLPSPNYEGSAVIVTCYSWLSVLIGYYNQQYIIITIIHVIPEEHLFSAKFTITSMFGCAEKGKQETVQEIVFKSIKW